MITYYIDLFLLRNKYIKNGPPNNAVIIPTGISIGEIIVLAMVSAKIINIPPINPEEGNSILWSGPTIILTIWGIISPTNPIIPLMDTTIDVIKVPKINIYSLIFSTCTPKLWADSSPVSMIFKSLAKKFIAMIDNITGMEIFIKGSHPFPAKLPRVQYIILFISLLYTTIRKDMIAVKNCPTATPDNKREVMGTLCLTLAILYTTNTVINPPINANMDIVEKPNRFICKLNTIDTLAPNAAPDDIPNT